MVPLGQTRLHFSVKSNRECTQCPSNPSLNLTTNIDIRTVSICIERALTLRKLNIRVTPPTLSIYLYIRRERCFIGSRSNNKSDQESWEEIGKGVIQ